MTEMLLTSQFARRNVDGGNDPAHPQFWFIMSMALIVGFVCAYPMNWWLVASHMKHGMFTVRKKSEAAPAAGMGAMPGMSEGSSPGRDEPSAKIKAVMTVLSFSILGGALAVVQLAL